MFARLLILFYAIVSYAVFLVSSLYAVGFVGNYLVPSSIDVSGATNLSEAIVVDLLLLGIFAIQHSIMARPAFKQWWTKILPVACQRSTYVLLSSLILLLLFWQWRPIPIQVWHIVLLAFLLGATNALDLPARQVFIVEMVGPERIMANSAGDWGKSNPLAVPEFIQEMKRRGHGEDVIRKVVYDNPLAFFRQCSRWDEKLTQRRKGAKETKKPVATR